MRRTTFLASDELIERLRSVAAQRGISMAELIREALRDKLRAYRPRPRSLGIGASGSRDTAHMAGEYRPEARPYH